MASKQSKQRKTTKVIKLQWIASIWCQKRQNNTKLQKGSIKNELHRFDVKMIKNVELRRKTFKTTQNYKSDQIRRQNDQNVDLRRKTFKTTKNYKSNQITMNCIV